MRIELLSTIDEHYVVPFRVTVQSLLDHLGSGVDLRWHVCHGGLSDESKHRIESHAEGAPLEFHWHDPPPSPGRAPVRGHFVPHVYTRLFAPDLLPADVTRFLYLDGDLLVLDGIEKLWSVELDGAVLAAVQDLAVPLVSSPMGLRRHAEIGFRPEAPYFNAGVFLADVAAWRRSRISRDAADYIEAYQADINLLDQDVLNAVARGRWKPLDLRWNLVSGPAGRSFRPAPGLDAVRLERAVANPGIVHFAGLLKPWIQSALGSPWAAEYGRVLNRVYPDYRWDRSARSRGLSLYDRHLRHWTHAIEKRIWSARRGF